MAVQTQQSFTQPVAQQAATDSPVQYASTATPAGDYSSLFQPGYLQAPATVNATTAAPGQLNNGLLNSLGANSTIQQILAGFAPQAQNSVNNLNQTLADFGVGGGQAVGAQTQLQAQLAAALGPTLASAIQSSQGNQLNAGEFNAGNLQSTNQFNAGQLNSAAAQNAQASNATNAANVSQYNQQQATDLADLLNQYYAQLGAFNQINTGGQGASNNQAVQYGGEVTVNDPIGQIFGPLMGAAGQVGAAYVKK